MSSEAGPVSGDPKASPGITVFAPPAPEIATQIGKAEKSLSAVAPLRHNYRYTTDFMTSSENEDPPHGAVDG